MAACAVRSVVLSEIQSVLSIARRRYGYLLVNQSVKSTQNDQSGIFHSFALLRTRLLRYENLEDLNPSTILRPFLDLIRHEHTSSTLTGASLQAVGHFIQSWDWSHAHVSDVLGDIVDAVTQCRFQETSTESDQNVLVLVVHVLQILLLSSVASQLSDHSMWQLIESLYALSRATRTDAHITLSLRSTATNVLHTAIEFIFDSSCIYHSSVSSHSSGFGLPCAIKVLGFLCQKLHPRTTSSPIPTATTRRDVLLSLSLLQRVLSACHAELFASVPSLLLFIKDDVCGALLRYGRLGASSEIKIPVLCLSIIRLLWTKLRPMLKMQIEALWNGIFIQTLYWSLSHLDLSHPIFPDHVGSSLETSCTFVPVEAVREEFTNEKVGITKLFAISFEIIDCLVDLLSESTVLPDLYVNYDCDGHRSDLIQTLFDLLSQIVSSCHRACQETTDEIHYVWAQAMGEVALRGLFHALYVIYTRTQRTIRSDTEQAQVLYQQRQRKKYFQQGIQEFNRKPLAGIRFLQQHQFLPTPLTPQALAMFLRSLPPGLSKTVVGLYLGGMGKEVKGFEKDEVHEADTIDFHRDVLAFFVESFNFEGESIVIALRRFLASFRLPGEAQQIDRILNMFSLQVYKQSRDRFLMASSDVAYLLSFSLIMLNTDLHNTNIRMEKKMKKEEFIKNNRHYGNEVSKSMELPSEFLSELYETIAKEEIKTCEDDGKHGEVTIDRWKDLLYQAEHDPQHSQLIVHHQFKTLRRAVSHPLPTIKPIPKRRKSTPTSPHHEETQPIVFTPCLSDIGTPYDGHIFELIRISLVKAFQSVFKQFITTALKEESNPSRPSEIPYTPDKTMLQLACNGLVLCAAVSAHYQLHTEFHQLFITICQLTALMPSELYPVAYNGRENGIVLFCTNRSAPVATAAMLKLVGTCARSINTEGFQYLLHALATLREFQALPDSFLSTCSFLNKEEMIELILHIRKNREELLQREAVIEAERNQSSGSNGAFFSGVAWLMSALDTSLGGSPSSSTRDEKNLNQDLINPQSSLVTPSDMTWKSIDLFLQPREDKKQTSFGTSGWIQTTLEPYRIDHLINDLAALPLSTLVHLILAIDQELIQVLKTSETTKRRTSEEIKSLTRRFSPSGCVFMEHVLARIMAAMPRDHFLVVDEVFWNAIQSHYSHLLEWLQPIILQNICLHGLTYENACLMIEKAIEGLIVLVLKSRDEKGLRLYVHFIRNLVDLDEELLIRPYLALILTGLKQIADTIALSCIDREEWIRLIQIMEWGSSQSSALMYAFAFLEKLIATEIWNTNELETITVMELFTPALMFALDAKSRELWPMKRPIELLMTLFHHIYEEDVEIEQEHRLRQLGGMTLVCRHHLRTDGTIANGDDSTQPQNEPTIYALECLQEMIQSNESREKLTGQAWLELLNHGLLVIASDILYQETRNRTLSTEDCQMTGPFLFYQRNVRLEWSLNKTPGKTQQPRRHSVITDPLSLRPHVMIVEIISSVVCEQLDHLLLLPRFASLWVELLDVLLTFIEQTKMENRGIVHGNNGTNGVSTSDEVRLALERRTVLSAHQEIIEHVRSIIRRLTVLQHKHEKQTTSETPPTSDGALSSASFHALMHVVVEKCMAKGLEFREQVIPSHEDTSSPVKASPSAQQLESIPRDEVEIIAQSSASL